MMYVTLALALFALCGYTEASSLRIIGGGQANPANYPFFVKVEKYVTAYLSGNGITEWDDWCGGTIINAKHVLTAWHCVCQDVNRPELGVVNPALVRVFYNIGTTPESVTANNIHLYGAYLTQSMSVHDIAILDMPSALGVPSSPSVSLPPPERRNDQLGVPVGLEGVAIGMGRTDLNSNAQSSSLKQASMVVAGPPYSGYFAFRAVAADGGSNICEGDSGGPWLRQNSDGGYTIYGVISNLPNIGGYPRCSPTLGSDFTSVSHYVDWIKQTTGMA